MEDDAFDGEQAGDLCWVRCVSSDSDPIVVDISSLKIELLLPDRRSNGNGIGDGGGWGMVLSSSITPGIIAVSEPSSSCAKYLPTNCCCCCW